MKIYVNLNHEIKAINECNDESLIMYEVNRIDTFGDKSDFMILNYCYKVEDGIVSVYPSKDLTTLELLDKNVIDKISILECENEKLKQELALTQDAVNEMLFMLMNMEVK